VAVVFNPATGGGDPAGRRQDTRKALAGLDVLWLETTEQDPGQGLTRRAVAEGVDLVIAQGGDGTVMACVTGLAGTDVPLAVLPGGTGNLLAANFDIPTSRASGAAWTCSRWARTASWSWAASASTRPCCATPIPA
jgi:diacylglycerol kinase family enzyme